MPSRTRFHPTITGAIHGLYKRFGDLGMDESFFPVTWHESGRRSEFIDAYLSGGGRLGRDRGPACADAGRPSFPSRTADDLERGGRGEDGQLAQPGGPGPHAPARQAAHRSASATIRSATAKQVDVHTTPVARTSAASSSVTATCTGRHASSPVSMVRPRPPTWYWLICTT